MSLEVFCPLDFREYQTGTERKITRHDLVAEQRVGLPSDWPLKSKIT